MRCKTKQRKGSRPDKILGYRRITANENSPGIRPACGTDEMNDHQREQSRRQNSAYRHRNYEGRFRKRRRPSLLIRLSKIDSKTATLQHLHAVPPTGSRVLLRALSIHRTGLSDLHQASPTAFLLPNRQGRQRNVLYARANIGRAIGFPSVRASR